MRNGNSAGRREKRRRRKVLTVPMRNGNYIEVTVKVNGKEFLPYL